MFWCGKRNKGKVVVVVVVWGRRLTDSLGSALLHRGWAGALVLALLELDTALGLVR